VAVTLAWPPGRPPIADTIWTAPPCPEPDARTGFIFTNPTDGTPMNPRSADKAFAAIRDRAGLDIERFHALRHAFTTLLRASGTRDRVAMKMTGHRGAAMLDYYDEGLESEQIEAAQRLDERSRMLRNRATSSTSTMGPHRHGHQRGFEIELLNCCIETIPLYIRRTAGITAASHVRRGAR
jgi:hypothetical protein